MDAASGRDLSVLLGAGRGLGGFHYLIDPIRGYTFVHFPFADPVAHQWPVVGSSWVPGNTIDDEFFVLPVDWVEVHPGVDRLFQSCDSWS